MININKFKDEVVRLIIASFRDNRQPDRVAYTLEIDKEWNGYMIFCIANIYFESGYGICDIDELFLGRFDKEKNLLDNHIQFGELYHIYEYINNHVKYELENTIRE